MSSEITRTQSKSNYEVRIVTPSSPSPKRSGPKRTFELPVVTLSIGVDPHMKEKLEQVSRAEDRSVSFICREALNLYLEKRRKAA
jgi:Ribbon-helix-helix protein, copG family